MIITLPLSPSKQDTKAILILLLQYECDKLTTTVSSCTLSVSRLELGTSLSNSSDLAELVDGSPKRSNPLDKPNVREGLEVEGVSLDISRSRKTEEKYPGPNEDLNCPLPTLLVVETSDGRLEDRTLEFELELSSIVCNTSLFSSSSSASSISTASDL